jgi:hypothetical protein
MAFVGLVVILSLTFAAFVIKSPTFARLILPGLLFFHIPIGISVHESRLLSPSSWPQRLRDLFGTIPGPQAVAAFHVVLASVLLYNAYRFTSDMLVKPHLARPLFERLLGKPEKNPSPRPALRELLTPVGPNEVVLADIATSWWVPSCSQGRVAGVWHYEFFVPDQKPKEAAVIRFFEGATRDERLAYLAKERVRWIVLNPDFVDARTMAELLDEKAVVSRTGSLTLMDAKRWADGPK